MPLIEKISCAAMLVTNDIGKVLCVYADWDNRGYGLPCGKIEGVETPLQAAIRELFEETGFEPVNDIKFLLKDEVDGVTVTTFVTKLNGEPVPSEFEGIPSWEEPAVLLQESNLYHKYNAAVLKAAGII